MKDRTYTKNLTMNATLTIIFDDAKTELDTIKAAMKKADFPIEGDPEILSK